jgi:hypothetical protein
MHVYDEYLQILHKKIIDKEVVEVIRREKTMVKGNVQW